MLYLSFHVKDEKDLDINKQLSLLLVCNEGLATVMVEILLVRFEGNEEKVDSVCEAKTENFFYFLFTCVGKVLHSCQFARRGPFLFFLSLVTERKLSG